MSTWPGDDAMSLLELLVVLAIVAVLTVLVVPASISMMRSFRLTQAQQQVTGMLDNARHAAIANNHTVEVRLYQSGDPDIPGQQNINPNQAQFRSYQLFIFQESGKATPLDKVENLPAGVIIDSGSYSTLLGTTQTKIFNPPLDPQVSIPESSTNYNTRVFQFRPDGTTNLQVGSQWYLTLHCYLNGNTGYADPLPTLPPTPPNIDFVTIQIDPIGGTLSTFRK